MSDIQILPGINIQWPWSRMLLSGQKTVETRSYALPKKYEGQPLALIETPGPLGLKNAGIFKAQIVGIITFAESFQYQSYRSWLNDQNRHKVLANIPMLKFKTGKSKWGWVVADVKCLEEPVAAPKKKGIVFANNCEIPIFPLEASEKS